MSDFSIYFSVPQKKEKKNHTGLQQHEGKEISFFIIIIIIIGEIYM